MKVSWQIDKKSLTELNKYLRLFETKMQKKIVRKGIRDWAKETTGRIKGNVSWDDPQMRRSIVTKVKTFRKNRGFWVGVGVEGSKKITNDAGDTYWIATRARWYHDGWTAYPKGKKSGRKTRGWRAGLRGQGGTKVYNTQFVEKERQAATSRLPQHIFNAIAEAVKE
jgi:hypothetical protein